MQKGKSPSRCDGIIIPQQKEDVKLSHMLRQPNTNAALHDFDGFLDGTDTSVIGRRFLEDDLHHRSVAGIAARGCLQKISQDSTDARVGFVLIGTSFRLSRSLKLLHTGTACNQIFTGFKVINQRIERGIGTRQAVDILIFV